MQNRYIGEFFSHYLPGAHTFLTRNPHNTSALSMDVHPGICGHIMALFVLIFPHFLSKRGNFSSFWKIIKTIFFHHTDYIFYLTEINFFSILPIFYVILLTGFYSSYWYIFFRLIEKHYFILLHIFFSSYWLIFYSFFCVIYFLLIDLVYIYYFPIYVFDCVVLLFPDKISFIRIKREINMMFISWGFIKKADLQNN